MQNNFLLDSLELDSLNFVSSIEIIEAGNVIKSIDFTKSNELKPTVAIKSDEKRKRGRPKLTEHQKAFSQFKRNAGKTQKFAIGEEPNRRSHFNYSNH
jgi:hypothetical protein